MAQITNVNQLKDVEPTAWAYEALRSLVERYGCIVGYPDQTFRGDRSLTRWEFAAGLNACLNALERLIQDGNNIYQEDIDKIKRLSQEFATELASIGARVDKLENRVAFLEDHQFSTTTKLSGEAVISLYGIAGGEKNGGESIPQVPVLGYRTRIELNTSFTGKDLLYTRLATGNAPTLVEETGTFQTVLGMAQPDDNAVAVEVLQYSYPVTDNITLVLEGFGGATDDFANTLNTLDGDGAFGALSLFGTRNPIYYISGQTGLAFTGNFNGLDITLGYMAGEGNEPTAGNGLFNGSYSAIAQVGYIPDGETGIALTYIHSYNQLDTNTGSTRSNFQYFTDTTFGSTPPLSANSLGLQFSAKVFEKIYLGGWAGYSKANTLASIDGQLGRGSLDIWNWALTFTVTDLFAEGNRAGIIFGMQPWVSASTVKLADGQRLQDKDSSYHIEGFYEFILNDNIRLTPGLIVITSPNYNNNNSTIFQGVLRTTFIF
ncbi:MAG: carbohydrate porin [Chlorogloea purpurea SAG 13.99]|nr:carbohydrate porin [Chlorogloea purpurea SAG 13.99]